MAPNPLERLIIDLLDKEDSFEPKLTAEHVEDKLINKQISIMDEKNVSSTRHPQTKGTEYNYQVWMDQMGDKGRGRKFEKYLEVVVEGYGVA